MVPVFCGKKVGGFFYFHVLARHMIYSRYIEILESAKGVSGTHEGVNFNVVKISNSLSDVSLLNYPQFFEEPFPKLTQSWRIDLVEETVRFTCFSHRTNPSILHRKELLLPPDHARREVFERLTEQLERAGLFAQSQAIGFQRQWCDRLHEAGYRVEDHRLVPLRVSPDRDHGAG